MINNFKALLSKVLSPKGDDVIVNMDGGVGGSWRLGSEEIECAIDEKVVDCSEMDNPPYIGVPAPVYLEDDAWFGGAPKPTEKQQDYMEQETEFKKQEEEKERDDGLTLFLTPQKKPPFPLRRGTRFETHTQKHTPHPL